jgi:hypothetical protein
MLGAAIVVLGGIGLWFARRRRPLAIEVEEDTPRAPVVPMAEPVPVDRDRLTIAFRPSRAGLNMLSATVEGELTIANEGDEPLGDIRVRTALMSVHAGQEAELAAFGREAAGRLAAPPFALASGERRTLRLVAATPHEALRTMTAAGRPMFVPVLAVAVQAAGAGQAVQAFAIGIERVDSAKLAPFWLDVPARSYDQVAARAHGPTRRA